MVDLGEVKAGFQRKRERKAAFDIFIRILMLAAACVFLAIGVNVVYEPLEMVIGGITGLSIAINSIVCKYAGIDVPVSALNLILNIPILIFAIKEKGWRFFCYALGGTAFLSLMLAVIPIAAVEKEDMFLAALLGGALTGVGIGLIFRSGLSTGGTDLISTLIAKKLKRVTQPVVLGIIDAVIVLLGMSVFGIYKSIYAILALFVMTAVSDAFLVGFSYTKLVMIVTERGEEMSKSILESIKRGVTVWDATGAYSGAGKDVLMCACGGRQVRTLIRTVSKFDRKSFVVILTAKEILGEGFEESL